MRVSVEKIRALYRKIELVREEVARYELAGDDPVVSVDALHRAIERMYGLRITIRLVRVRSVHFTSMLRRYDDGAVFIDVKYCLADQEKRFAVAKELAHVALDEREDWSPNPGPIIDELIEIGVLGVEADVGKQHSAAITSEHTTGLAAVEFLYPFERRDTDAREVAEGRANWTEIAERYKLPVRAIRLAQSSLYKEARQVAFSLKHQRIPNLSHLAQSAARDPTAADESTSSRSGPAAPHTASTDP